MAKQLERQKVAEEVLTQLRSRILTGKYAAGAKLPPERELAKEMGVNRASLREALKKLEHLGLVTIRQGDGTRVTHFEQTAGIELISHLIPLSPEITTDVLEFRRLFGREIARLAAVRATPQDLAKLRDLADQAREPSLSSEQVFDLDFAFYGAMAAASSNRVVGLLVNTVRNATDQFKPLLSILIVSRERVSAHHDELIAAIEARDGARAADVAAQYLQDGEKRVLQGS